MTIVIESKGVNFLIVRIQNYEYNSIFKIDSSLPGEDRVIKFINDVSEEIKDSIKIKLRKHLTDLLNGIEDTK